MRDLIVNNKFDKEEKVFLTLACIFVSLLVISNIVAVKIISVSKLVGPAAVIFYGLTFAISDILAEIWGKERVKYVIKLGFIVTLLSAIIIRISILLPTAPFWTDQAEYELILGSNIRIVIASMVAYLISQFHDIWAYHFWRKITKEKYLWIRNNLSTVVSQMIDTIVFIIIVFYGTDSPILSMIVGQYLVKIALAVLDTPLVYLAVELIHKVIRQDESMSPIKTIKETIISE